jgi:hypothetical protein
MSPIGLNIALLNLAVTGATFVFFLLAPLFGFPARFGDAVGLAQIAAPVFLGYLGFAGAFAARLTPDKNPGIDLERLGLLRALAYGVTLTYVLIVATACAAFWISNRRQDILDGTGMDLDTLRTALTLALGVFTAVSNHIMTRLFPTERTK